MQLNINTIIRCQEFIRIDKDKQNQSYKTRSRDKV